MVRLRRDVDGCGCFRCQHVAYHQLQSSLSDALAWSVSLPLARPSVVLVFLAVGLGQVLLLGGPRPWLLPGAILGLVGAFVGRGYVGIVGRDSYGSRRHSPLQAIGTVMRRLPAFGGALVLIGGLLLAGVVVVRQVVAEGLRGALQLLGVSAVNVDIVLLVVLAGGLLYAFVKFCFVPEACFVGGYGPLESLRVSWTITTLHRAKAAAIVGGFIVLLGIGVLLDTHLTGPRSPVMLSLRYRETAIVLRSFGLSTASGVRVMFDLFVTTVYSGVFVHQYIANVFET